MERRRIIAALATQGPYTAAELDVERIGNRLLDHVNFVTATARRWVQVQERSHLLSNSTKEEPLSKSKPPKFPESRVKNVRHKIIRP
jgi:hypothetical protein